MSVDSDKLVSWLLEGASEIANAHAYLDALGVPDGPEPDIDGTLAARIALLHDRQTADASSPT